MSNCVICGKIIWPFQEEKRNAHRKCDEIFFAGYDAYKSFANTANQLHGYLTPNQLYHKRTMANWEVAGGAL